VSIDEFCSGRENVFQALDGEEITASDAFWNNKRLDFKHIQRVLGLQKKLSST